MIVLGPLFLALMSLSHVMGTDVILQVKQEVNGNNCDSADNEHVSPDNEHVSPDSEHVSPDNNHVSTDNNQEPLVETTTIDLECRDVDPELFTLFDSGNGALRLVYLINKMTLSDAVSKCEEMGMILKDDVLSSNLIPDSIRTCEFSREVWLNATESSSYSSGWDGMDVGLFIRDPAVTNYKGVIGILGEIDTMYEEVDENLLYNAICQTPFGVRR